MGVHASGLSFVQVARPAKGQARVEVAEFRAFAGAAPAQVLAGLVAEHDLKRRPCTTLLREGAYRLLQTEAPDVKVEELRAALRWRIKDLIDFHVNDATIDVFDVPIQVPGRAALVYVVVGRNEEIRERVDLLHGAGLALEIIDIPELAQRNLARLLPEDQDGVAMLTLGEDIACITITKGGALYLSRSVPVTPALLGDSQGPERLLLELQRSLDYFESSFRQNPVMHVVVAPGSEEARRLVAFLQANLAQRVVLWDPQACQEVTGANIVPDSCFLTFGAALRKDEVAL